MPRVKELKSPAAGDVEREGVMMGGHLAGGDRTDREFKFCVFAVVFLLLLPRILVGLFAILGLVPAATVTVIAISKLTLHQI